MVALQIATPTLMTPLTTCRARSPMRRRRGTRRVPRCRSCTVDSSASVSHRPLVARPRPPPIATTTRRGTKRWSWPCSANRERYRNVSPVRLAENTITTVSVYEEGQFSVAKPFILSLYNFSIQFLSLFPARAQHIIL